MAPWEPTRASWSTIGGRPRSSATVLAALLACTLALAAMLAYEAREAAQSHRATADRALHDYAAVAAWELVAGINDDLQATAGAALAPFTRMHAASPYELLPAPNALTTTAAGVLRCASPAADSARYYFRLDFRDGSLVTAGATVPSAEGAWLADTVAAHARTVYQPDWRYAVIRSASRAHGAIIYAVKYAEHGAPLAAFGMRTCDDAIGSTLIASVVARRSLLPASITGGTPNDSVLAISVRDASDRLVFGDAGAAVSPYVATAPLVQAGGLTVRAAIRPRAVELLVLGTAPAARVPLLLALLTLTAAMIVITIVQLRREQELSRLRSDFISSVSHELRTPLSQILLFAETLELGRVRSDVERSSATHVIVQESRRLMHLVENILHFSRAERKMARLGPEPLELGAALEAIVDDWRPLAGAADVSIRTAMTPDVCAVADRGALRQIVLNLLDNAVKYGPSSQTVTVGAGVVDGRARLWVDDQGAGIPRAARERVWQPFYRLARDANSAVAGSGIGLYVVRELARLQGGDAWSEDAPGGGARFIVALPLGAPARGATAEHALPSRAEVGA